VAPNPAAAGAGVTAAGAHRGLQGQMVVVAHEHMSVQYPIGLGAGLEQAGLKRRLRSLGLEDVRPVVAPVNYVVAGPGEFDLNLRAMPAVSADSRSGQYPQPDPFFVLRLSGPAKQPPLHWIVTEQPRLT
jgi:hypothetical protein